MSPFEVRNLFCFLCFKDSINILQNSLSQTKQVVKEEFEAKQVVKDAFEAEHVVKDEFESKHVVNFKISLKATSL